MGAFKNEKNGTWYVQFRYTDWQGLRQQKLKRGFATKREAQEWERAFLTEKKADVTMPFKTFTKLYEKDVRPKLKENTWLTKEHIIKTKILPYFEHKRLCDISAKDVIAWQNEIRKMTNSSGELLSQGYLKTIHNQLSSLFNHAIKIYGLRLNPASMVGNMGKEERKEMSYWTVEEYSKFSDEMMDKPISYYAFANDYEIITRLKKFADSYGICLLLVHHTRKQNSEDKFDMISGTNGLLGAADGGFILRKEKRTSNSATLEVSGRDQPDQKIYLNRNPETLVWELERTETELWKLPPEPLLENIAVKITNENPEWYGSPTELVEFLGVEMKANALTMKLNINAGRLFDEYGIRYQNKRCHDGRKVSLTYEQRDDV